MDGFVGTTSSVIDADGPPAANDAGAADARLRRVQAHIEELHRAGRAADADAVAFVRDIAERTLRGPGLAARADPSPRQRTLRTTGKAALARVIPDLAS